MVFLPIAYSPHIISRGQWCCENSRDKPAPFRWTEYVITLLHRSNLDKAREVYLSASFQVFARDWLRTASFIQRYAVETVTCESLSIRGRLWRLNVETTNLKPACSMAVHQMKTLRCCWVDFVDTRRGRVWRIVVWLCEECTRLLGEGTTFLKMKTIWIQFAFNVGLSAKFISSDLELASATCNYNDRWASYVRSTGERLFDRPKLESRDYGYHPIILSQISPDGFT